MKLHSLLLALQPQTITAAELALDPEPILSMQTALVTHEISDSDIEEEDSVLKLDSEEEEQAFWIPDVKSHIIPNSRIDPTNLNPNLSKMSWIEIADFKVGMSDSGVGYHEASSSSSDGGTTSTTNTRNSLTKSTVTGAKLDLYGSPLNLSNLTESLSQTESSYYGPVSVKFDLDSFSHRGGVRLLRNSVITPESNIISDGTNSVESVVTTYYIQRYYHLGSSDSDIYASNFGRGTDYFESLRAFARNGQRDGGSENSESNSAYTNYGNRLGSSPSSSLDSFSLKFLQCLKALYSSLIILIKVLTYGQDHLSKLLQGSIRLFIALYMFSHTLRAVVNAYAARNRRLRRRLMIRPETQDTKGTNSKFKGKNIDDDNVETEESEEAVPLMQVSEFCSTNISDSTNNSKFKLVEKPRQVRLQNPCRTPGSTPTKFNFKFDNSYNITVKDSETSNSSYKKEIQTPPTTATKNFNKTTPSDSDESEMEEELEEIEVGVIEEERENDEDDEDEDDEMNEDERRRNRGEVVVGAAMAGAAMFSM